MAEQAGQSRNQISRYIRLTELIPELLDMVDEKKIAFNPAYELSFLKKEEQTRLLDAMDSEQATPFSLLWSSIVVTVMAKKIAHGYVVVLASYGVR